MERLILKQLSIIIISFSFLGCSSLPESNEDLNGNKVDVSLDKKETLPKPEINLEKEIGGYLLSSRTRSNSSKEVLFDAAYVSMQAYIDSMVKSNFYNYDNPPNQN